MAHVPARAEEGPAASEAGSGPGGGPRRPRGTTPGEGGPQTFQGEASASVRLGSRVRLIQPQEEDPVVEKVSPQCPGVRARVVHRTSPASGLPYPFVQSLSLPRCGSHFSGTERPFSSLVAEVTAPSGTPQIPGHRRSGNGAHPAPKVPEHINPTSSETGPGGSDSPSTFPRHRGVSGFRGVVYEHPRGKWLCV